MFKRSPNFTKLLLGLALVAGLSIEARAQEASRPERGLVPNGSFSVSDIENINLLNGNVNVSIPLASLPPIAGGKLSWTVSAQYNSKVWNITRAQQNDDPLTWAPYSVDYPGAEGGWSVGHGYMIFFRNANDDFERQWYPGNSGIPASELNLINNYQWWKVVLRMPDGAEHELRPTDYSPYSGTAADFLRGFYNVKPAGSAMRYHSVDGTYLFARISDTLDWTVYLPDGTQITQTPAGMQRIQDTNGNKIKIFSDANGTHYQDEQGGRELRLTYNPAGAGQYQVWYKTVGGTEHHIDINLGTTTVRGQLYSVTHPGCEYDGLTQELLSGIAVVREIVFPQTEPGQPPRQFTFTYNSDTSSWETDSAIFYCPSMGESYARTVSHGLGELSKIDLPSGAAIEYTYKHDGVRTFSPFGIGDYIAQNVIDQKKLTHDGIDEF
jgi:hypothetical protein